jgi:putative hemolysin
VDEYGGVSGLVTMEDLLERIVGNIYDEFDPLEERDISRVSDTQWRIAGSADLESISEELGIELPENEEYGTLGGLILDCLEAIPEDGTKPVLDALGLHIEVQEIKDRRIEWALVSVVPQPEIIEE